MKTIYLIILALLCGFNLFGQTVNTDYAMNQPNEIRLWDDTKQDVDASPILYRALRGDIFTLIRKRTGTIDSKKVSGWGIVFWHFTADRTQEQKRLGFGKDVQPKIIIVDEKENGKEFFISDDQLKTVATTDFNKRTGIATLNAFILPFKIRFKNSQPGGISDLTQSVNVGPAVSLFRNYGGPFGKNSFSFIAALNATNISVDDKTVPGVVTGKTTMLGLSPTLGINWQHENITFGVFTGLDLLFGDAMDKWAYRKSPWLGISFGTSITDLTTPKKSNGQ